MRRITIKKRIFLVLLSALLLCLSACNPKTVTEEGIPDTLTVYENKGEKPVEGGTLRLALTGAKSLNPLLADNENNLQIYKLIFDGLFRSLPDKSVEAVLCDGFTMSQDGLSYTFRIRDGISFHNGQKLTAKDVEASLGVLLSSTGFYSGRLAAVESYSANGMNLTVNLAYPVANFTALLDFPVMSAADTLTRSELYVPNGTGRYKVQSYKQGKELYLSVNNNYYKKFSPYIQEILVYQLKDSQTAISMMENMQLDLLTSATMNLYEYTPKRNAKLSEVPGNQFTFLGINNQKPALLSPLTRTALSLAINREKLLSSCAVSYATATAVPLPPKSVLSGAYGENSPYDIEQAKKLLFDDDWLDSNGDGVFEKEVYGETAELSLSILVNSDNQIRIKLAEKLKDCFKEIGIPAIVEAVSFEDYKTRISEKNYDVFIGSVSIGDNFDLDFLLKTDENVCGISDERVDQLLSVLPLQQAETQKLATYQNLCELMNSKMFFVGLYFENKQLIFDERLKGEITPSATDIFYGIEEWFLSK